MKQLIRSSALLTVVVALLTLGLVAPGSAASSAGAVKGVMTLDGKPVKGLRIELHLTGDDGFTNKTLAVDTTNSKGAYSFRFDTSDPEYSGHTILIKDPQGRIINTSRWFRDRPGRTVTRNATLKRGATITGSVRRGDGRSTGRLRVDVRGPLTPLDPNRDTPLSYEESVMAATSGAFRIQGLPAGTYHLGFVDESKSYASQCYDNIAGPVRECESVDGATAIRVTAGGTVTLDPQVMTAKGQRILGSVTDTSGLVVTAATVLAVDEDGRVQGRDRARGAFTIGPLKAGRYRLSIEPQSPWAPQWYDRQATQAGAKLIDVTVGDVSGIQVQLKSRARIQAVLTPGRGTVKVAVDVTRSATGSKPSGKATIRWGTVSKTVTLAKGKGTVKLSGLPKGKRQITVSYAGTPSTAAATKLFYAVVK